ncbi:ABC transporter ATP-binding protein, partial [Streptomyces kronopolitis]
ELIDTEPALTERPDARPLPADAPATVAFEDVAFAYAPPHREPGEESSAADPLRPVLDGFSLRIEAGETVAVVGTSGSGKSTVSLLLPRFYDVTAGRVLIGGHDVRELTLESLRAAIGLVPETSFLFSHSVRDNIAYGHPSATDAQVRAAARAARADGFISALPDGYDTKVGEQGLTLSGGQRQRVALARAILTDPRLLVLDDATSAVDARVEHEIHEALRGVMAGRTTLLIAHRASTLALADRVAVLDGGRLVDIGTQEELESRCALYRRLLTDPDELGEAAPDPAGEAADGFDAELAELTEHSESVEGAESAEGAADRPGEWTGQGARPGGERAAAGTITPELWVRREQEAEAGAAGPAARAAAGAGPGIGSAMAGMAATPELLAQVAALPPATDTPEIDEDRALRPERSYGLR